MPNRSRLWCWTTRSMLAALPFTTLPLVLRSTSALSALVVEDLLAQGGLAEIEKKNQKKAGILYDTIDESNGFYVCPVEKSVRSLMNVTFLSLWKNLILRRNSSRRRLPRKAWFSWRDIDRWEVFGLPFTMLCPWQELRSSLLFMKDLPFFFSWLQLKRHILIMLVLLILSWHRNIHFLPPPV